MSARILAQPAESAESFTCRTLQIPEARRCVARCDAAYPATEDGDLRFSCVHACTVSGLWAMADCRAALSAGGRAGAEPLQATSVASR